MSAANPPLRTMKSSGHLIGTDPETGALVDDSKPCPGCGEIIDSMELISRRGHEWMHAACLTNVVAAANAREAWLVLGSQLSRRPGDFSRSETRVVVSRLLALAGGLPVPRWQADADAEDERRELAHDAAKAGVGR